MTASVQKQQLNFQAEVTQLLQLMVNSLYSNKEIFLRELISNASDACDKLRFEALSNESLYEGDSKFNIEVQIDKTSGTLSVRDNGIGMQREEVIQNIGTIAKSGTREFLESLTGDQAKDAKLIGQFGVGFYSSFIVADRVTLTTRYVGVDSSQGVLWESDGKGSYEINTIEVPKRGTQVTLHLKEDEKDFLDSWKIRSVITKFSDHVMFPVRMKKLDEKGNTQDEWETVNRASALWVRPKTDITDDEYKEFYKHVAHDFEDPLAWTHHRVEGKLEYTSLLYIPSRAPFDLFDREHVHGIKLYVQRVFIMDDAEHLIPRYLRFARGVIDSNDLPLNVSREILQSNRVIDSIRSGSVKKILGLLAEIAKHKPEQYAAFWEQFGKVLKEGPAEDVTNRDAIGKLLRFSSTHEDMQKQDVCLETYVSRMKPGQDHIYYITADSFTAAKNSPHLEIFRKKDIEVLLLCDRVDEWLVAHLTEFEGRQLQSVAKGELDLSTVGMVEGEQEKIKRDVKDTIKRIRTVLDDQVEDVRVSHRLTKSPACIVLNDQDMALYMQHLLKQAGHEVPTTKPVLEINPAHPILDRMKDMKEDERFSDWARLLFDQALLAEGAQLEDPAGFVSKLNELMLDIVE